jgi:hypothetical protein
MTFNIKYLRNDDQNNAPLLFDEPPDEPVLVGLAGDVIGRLENVSEREGVDGMEFVSVFPGAEDGGELVPDPPAAVDSCANPIEGGSARNTE